MLPPLTIRLAHALGDGHLELPSVGMVAISTSCALAYNLDWQHDLLCKYQVHRGGARPVPLVCQYLSPGSEATILLRRDDSARKMLHNLISLAALSGALYVSWKQGWLQLPAIPSR